MQCGTIIDAASVLLSQIKSNSDFSESMHEVATWVSTYVGK